MLKDTCGALGGPPHDGQGSASGGSNFSKPWGGAAGSNFVCVCVFVGCECVHVVCVCLCPNFENKLEFCDIDVFLCGVSVCVLFPYQLLK